MCRLSTNFINACNHKYLDSLQYCTYYVNVESLCSQWTELSGNGLPLILVLYNLMHGMYVGYCNLINLYILLHAINYLGGFISSRWLLILFSSFKGITALGLVLSEVEQKATNNANFRLWCYAYIMSFLYI